MTFCNSFGNRQPKSGAAGQTVQGGDPIEALKNEGKAFLRDATPGIPYPHDHLIPSSADLNMDLAVRLVVFDRVGQQIQQELFKSVSVALDGG